jgi:hypothetical protein
MKALFRMMEQGFFDLTWVDACYKIWVWLCCLNHEYSKQNRSVLIK